MLFIRGSPGTGPIRDGNLIKPLADFRTGTENIWENVRYFRSCNQGRVRVVRTIRYKFQGSGRVAVCRTPAADVAIDSL